jgi:hypothetical protein
MNDPDRMFARGGAIEAVVDARTSVNLSSASTCEAVRTLGLEVRAGLHTGECERIGNEVGGIAVHIGARVVATAVRAKCLC